MDYTEKEERVCLIEEGCKMTRPEAEREYAKQQREAEERRKPKQLDLIGGVSNGM